MLLVPAHLPGDLQSSPLFPQVVGVERQSKFCGDRGRILLVPSDTLFRLRDQHRSTDFQVDPVLTNDRSLLAAGGLGLSGHVAS